MPPYPGSPYQTPTVRNPAPPRAAAPAGGAGSGVAYYDGPGRRNGSYNAEHAGSDGAAPGWATDTIRNRYTDALNRTGGVAERAEDAYLDRAENFDATSYPT